MQVKMEQSIEQRIHPNLTDELSSSVTGRSEDLFAADLQSRKQEITDRLRASRVLVIGGAGSIGSSTVDLISQYQPVAVHVVDQDENNLAEVVRNYRNNEQGSSVTEFRTMALDYGSGVMRRFLNETPPYDYVLNFAAVKHVRSEKDVCSLLHMLDTNVVKQARFLDWLSQTHEQCHYFSVSTDKAANPVSLMGATKRIMEGLLFAEKYSCRLHVTSARFANVAFSNGSLLASFLTRLSRRQPLAVPENTRRYFVSLREAGQICLLASLCAPRGWLLFPCLDAEVDLVDLKSIAVKTLQHHGLDAEVLHDPNSAQQLLPKCLTEGRYPLLVTKQDTDGEKPFEEFVAHAEVPTPVGFDSLLGIDPAPIGAGPLFDFVEFIERVMKNPDLEVTKNELVQRIQQLIPQFEHVKTGKSLDDRL